MKITRLHVILIAIIILTSGIFLLQVYQNRERKQAARQNAEERAAIEVQSRGLETSSFADQAAQQQKLREQKKDLAVQAVAVAGEYWQIAKKEGRDIAQGQATLRAAKEKLSGQNFEEAWTLARRSIDELKAAPARKKIYYTVQKGDSLWRIAKMPRHYGRGSRWVTIWRANEKKVPDFNVIYPRLVLLIPKK